MTPILKQIIWVLKKAGRHTKKTTQYYISHPSEAWGDLVAYAKENPKEFALTCALIGGGVLVIVLPLAIGFGPAGPILGSIAAGWQSGLGAVAAGSLFAVLQSMAMTGVFTGIGVGMMGFGLQTPLINRLLRSVIRMHKSLDNSPGQWYLHRDHINPRSSEPDLDTEETDKRLLITNSRATYNMVWESLDPSNNSATIKEHAWNGIEVRIYLIEGPQTELGNEGFFEKFADHTMGCNPNCQCIGEIEEVQFF